MAEEGGSEKRLGSAYGIGLRGGRFIIRKARRQLVWSCPFLRFVEVIIRGARSRAGSVAGEVSSRGRWALSIDWRVPGAGVPSCPQLVAGVVLHFTARTQGRRTTCVARTDNKATVAALGTAGSNHRCSTERSSEACVERPTPLSQ
jgi:hypothetical protein